MWGIIIFNSHIRKMIFSIMEEHSCLCSTINSQWNRQEAVFSLQRPGSCNQQNKEQNVQTLQNRVVKEIISRRPTIIKYAFFSALYITERKATERYLVCIRSN